VMLNYQSTSYHDALAVRRLFGLRPAPEFLTWLQSMGIYGGTEPLALDGSTQRRLMHRLGSSLEKVVGLPKVETNLPLSAGRPSCSKIVIALQPVYSKAEAAPPIELAL